MYIKEISLFCLVVFKKLKHNFQLHFFNPESENGIITQICVLILLTYFLIY